MPRRFDTLVIDTNLGLQHAESQTEPEMTLMNSNELIMSPPELFAAMMRSQQPIVIDGKLVKVRHNPEDLFVVINLSNQINSSVVQANQN